MQAGEAIQLECECRGDLALRHHSCAVKWAHVKGDNVCDICKQPIKNLPAITPRAPSEAGSDVDITAFDDVDPQNHPHGLHGKSCYLFSIASFVVTRHMWLDTNFSTCL